MLSCVLLIIKSFISDSTLVENNVIVTGLDIVHQVVF